MFSTWAEVPPELRGGRWPLRPEMFPFQGSNPLDPADADLCQLRRSARFYPHRCNTGGFFVALFQKTAEPGAAEEIPRPLLPPSAKLKVCKALTPGPLARLRHERVQPGDASWAEIVEFFGLEPSWAAEKIQEGLMFWRFEKDELVSVSVVSRGVAQIYDAVPTDRKPLPWVKLGTALFEQLPKDFVMVAPSRWRVAQEGASMIAPVLGKRRLLVPRRALLQILRSESYQAALEACPGLGLEPLTKAGAVHEQGSLAGCIICGGVLVGAELRGGAVCWASGALTPHQLRVLIGSEEAAWMAALLEEEEEAADVSSAI
ncbi:unnamed protein product [Polarella glacialis]|uniref:Uncharacterized protein n=1 Tax=Polarella glacialis TaxID=89957 RepID=A0A813GX40_POLGL|nr:unnamed protein product [Polarella glacialis]